jgi:hypothetical protein
MRNYSYEAFGDSLAMHVEEREREIARLRDKLK